MSAKERGWWALLPLQVCFLVFLFHCVHSQMNALAAISDDATLPVSPINLTDSPLFLTGDVLNNICTKYSKCDMVHVSENVVDAETNTTLPYNTTCYSDPTTVPEFLSTSTTNYFIFPSSLTLTGSINTSADGSIMVQSCGVPGKTYTVECNPGTDIGLILWGDNLKRVGIKGLRFTGCSRRATWAQGNDLTVWVYDSMFEDNGIQALMATAPQFDSEEIGKSQAEADVLKKSGSAIYTTGNVVTINSTFKRNQGSSGAAIYLLKGELYSISSNFTANNATIDQGGAIYAFVGGVTAIRSRFFYNQASSGGAISSGWTVDLTDCWFQENQATTPVDPAKKFLSEASNMGGAVKAANNVTATNCNFIKNEALYFGGGIVSAMYVTLNRTNASRNFANYDGGFVYAREKVDIVGPALMVNNVAEEGSGGAVWLHDTDSDGLTVADTNFSANIAGKSGGAFYVISLDAQNSKFYNNSAQSGGAIWVAGDCYLRNCLLELNRASHAAGSGGAIYGDYHVDLDDANCTNNIADNGGAVWARDYIQINKGNFSGNIAVNTGGGGGGGGVFMSLGYVEITGGNFTNNTAVGAAGSIANALGNLTIKDSFIQSNGVSPNGTTQIGSFYSDLFVTARNNTFLSNTCTQSGCAIAAKSGVISSMNRYESNTVVGSDASTGGGAVWSGVGVSSFKDLFLSNSAPLGGGIYSKASAVTLSQSNFTSNYAQKGGAIYSEQGTIEGPNTSTFSNNSAPASGADYWSNTVVQPPVETTDYVAIIVPVAICAVLLFIGIWLGTVWYLRRQRPKPIDYEELVRKIQQKHQWTEAGTTEAQHLIGQLQQQEGLVARNQFALLETLGRGQFGTVSRGVVFLEGRAVVCAIKTAVQTDPKAHADFLREANMMKKVSHPNVVRTIGICDPSGATNVDTPEIKHTDSTISYDTFEAQERRKRNRDGKDEEKGEGGKSAAGGSYELFLLLEYMDMGDLKSFLVKNKDLPLIQRLWFAKEIATGLEYLASLGIVHRDIAARNVLLGRGTGPDGRPMVKISDLGLARHVSSDTNMYVKGGDGGDLLPVRWMAPEAIFDGKYDQSTDVWSFGITVWEIESNAEVPYSFLTTATQVMQAIHHGVRLQKPRNCPGAVMETMSSCWNAVPEQRPTFSDLRSMFESLYQSELVGTVGGISAAKGLTDDDIVEMDNGYVVTTRAVQKILAGKVVSVPNSRARTPELAAVGSIETNLEGYYEPKTRREYSEVIERDPLPGPGSAEDGIPVVVESVGGAETVASSKP